jgi:hypothetical protein
MSLLSVLQCFHLERNEKKKMQALEEHYKVSGGMAL